MSKSLKTVEDHERPRLCQILNKLKYVRNIKPCQKCTNGTEGIFLTVPKSEGTCVATQEARKKTVGWNLGLSPRGSLGLSLSNVKPRFPHTC
ncbi:hypothetical protein CEXT_551741 [Caerostris extrusa]|uniref:Uncharacterized protein n=1 Tax=Caerostris extrusa TaxID=172846 RepID=A0AAV4THL3_CAEEX|nr:hypothetical protein CEXT_551741 [Caerostris extrusa]